MAATKSKQKKADLPPRGPRNSDPITDAAGAHPIEAGVGAALGGAAAGIAAGIAAGPVGAVAGAIIGGVAGGYGGKAVGEYIDPTTEDAWLKDNFEKRPYASSPWETFVPAYRFGARAEANNIGKTFSEIETDLEDDYRKSDAAGTLPWSQARDAVCDAYDRTCQIRKERSGNS